jgi:hypothetical protein
MAGVKGLAKFVPLLASITRCFMQRRSLACRLQLASNPSTGANRYLGGCE